ncbi:Uncharacterised protein [Mycobacteroides abscessus subsp. massiliense]|nr:Uncharacterised protein [Mycobacteroides abscessus subsp. massiliense]
MCVGLGVGTDLSDQSDFLGVEAVEHLPGHGEALGGVDSDQLTQRDASGHVGDQPPFGFQDRELGVGRGEPEVGGQCQL